MNTTALENFELSQIYNPLDISLPIFLAFVVGKTVSVEILDTIIFWVLEKLKWPKMPSRVPDPINKGLESLELVDYTCLILNALIEVVFITHVYKYSLTLPSDFESVTFVNTVVAFYMSFLVNDFLYYFLHRTMHLSWIYPYIHKHHHRQILPRRGYFDGANTTPMEQTCGVILIGAGLLITEKLIGLHVFALHAYFQLFAVFALLNHTPFDVNLPAWIGLGYSVRAHEMHHRKFTCNYSQNTMVFDKMFNTFQEYTSGRNTEKDNQKKSRSE